MSMLKVREALDLRDQTIGNKTNVLKIWYRGGWSTFSICYAESTNGINWTRYTANPVISNVAFPFGVPERIDGFLYLYGFPNAELPLIFILQQMEYHGL